MSTEELKRSPLRDGQLNNGPEGMPLQRRNGTGYHSDGPSSRKRFQSEGVSPNNTETFSDEGDSFLW